MKTYDKYRKRHDTDVQKEKQELRKDIQKRTDEDVRRNRKIKIRKERETQEHVKNDTNKYNNGKQ